MNFSANLEKKKSRIMAPGDTVIIYERHDSLSYITLEKSRIHDNKFGTFHHNDFIGKKFGSRVYSKGRAGWVYALEPSPELWSHAMHTRTQIVDESDASFVTFSLDVYPGCKVIESGTGSGSMSLSLARAVSPSGHVFSYEYNASRAEEATKEFASLGVSHLISVQCRDVCAALPAEDGAAAPPSAPDIASFGDVPDATIDAVFLDLPKPWLALPSARRALKPGKSICCYSPCMEQVIRTCEELRALGFHSIRMMELRQRPLNGREVPIEVPDLGRPLHSSSPDGAGDGEAEDSEMADHGGHEQEGEGEGGREEDGRKKRRRNAYEVKTLPPRVAAVAKANPTMKGHTAFLTFAVAPADGLPEKQAAEDLTAVAADSASSTSAVRS